jgi:hypothetical protein
MNSHERRMLERRWEREHGEKPKVHPKPESPPRLNWWQHLTRVSGWAWAFVVGASVVLTFFILWSDVTNNPRGRLKDDDPFSTLFSVTNEGTFAIKNVRFSCHMNDLEITNYRIRLVDQEGAADPRGEPEIRGRKGQDVDCALGSMGIPMRPPPGGPTPEYHVADITLTVCYRPRFWPWETKQSERFIGRTDGTHKIVEWSHQATNVGESFECP